MLERLEMHQVQDKQLLLDEMNETRDAVNELNKKLNNFMKPPRSHKKKAGVPSGSPGEKSDPKPKTGPVKSG